MDRVWEFGMLLVFIGAVVVRCGAVDHASPRHPGLSWRTAPCVVTGVSPRPDETGQQFVTITGVINGPTVNEHVVYQRLEVDVEQWPTMGQLFPVVYSPKNPDNWSFAPAEGPI